MTAAGIRVRQKYPRLSGAVMATVTAERPAGFQLLRCTSLWMMAQAGLAWLRACGDRDGDCNRPAADSDSRALVSDTTRQPCRVLASVTVTVPVASRRVIY